MSSDNPREASEQLHSSDRAKLTSWTDIIRPEPEQILPRISLEPEEAKKPAAAERLNKTKALAKKILDKIDSLNKKVDEKCSRFSVSSQKDVGSDLFKAMVRVFNERTTVVTYDHYKRALEFRRQLAEEDAARLRLE